MADINVKIETMNSYSNLKIGDRVQPTSFYSFINGSTPRVMKSGTIKEIRRYSIGSLEVIVVRLSDGRIINGKNLEKVERNLY